MGQDLESASKRPVEEATQCDSMCLQIDAALFYHRNRKALFSNPMIKLLVGKSLKETIYTEETLLLPTAWDNTQH